MAIHSKLLGDASKLSWAAVTAKALITTVCVYLQWNKQFLLIL